MPPIPYLPHIPAEAPAITSHLPPHPLPPKNILKFTCFHHCVYLVQAKVSVAFCDGLTEAVREWIQHAVVRVN